MRQAHTFKGSTVHHRSSKFMCACAGYGRECWQPDWLWRLKHFKAAANEWCSHEGEPFTISCLVRNCKLNLFEYDCVLWSRFTMPIPQNRTGELWR